MSRSEEWEAHGRGFPSDIGSFWDLDAASNWQRPTSDLSEWALASWYGRANYTFKGKYLVTLNARYDGSSVFSSEEQWAFFPSGALAWDMREEPFMRSLDLFSQLKWRVSYGFTGNRSIDPYQTFAALGSVLTIQDGAPVNAVAPDRPANRGLTWETTSQLDIGVDIGLVGGRVGLTLDYYSMITEDLLFEVPLPEYSGFTSQLTNIGKVRNRGFELTLSTYNLVGKVKWTTDFNISTNRNEVIELPGGEDIFYSSGPGHMVGLGNTQILREGEPVGAFFGWVYDGVYQEGDNFLPGGGFEQAAGGERFLDLDGVRDENGNLTGTPDGMLNNDDRTVIGDPNPDFIWGLNNRISWRGFDLDIFFQASHGNDLLSYTLLELDLLSGLNNATTEALRRWTPENTNTDIPRAFGGRTRRVSSRWIRDGSFVRLKNIALGYTLPAESVKRFGFASLRMFVSAQNLLTFTNYDGFDPEVNYRTDGATNGNRNLGLDYASYPNARSFTVGLNANF